MSSATPPFNLAKAFEAMLIKAASALPEFEPGQGDEFNPLVRLAEPRFGFLQANGVLAFAKARGLNPRGLAETLVAKLEAGGQLAAQGITLSLAGPGFINAAYPEALLTHWVQTYANEGALKSGAAAAEGIAGNHIVVDFSAPNTAKQMHVGHIRSTMIGEALCRIFEYCGAQVVRDNHIGDWGTQFGILIMQIKHENIDLNALQQDANIDAIEALEDLYRRGSQHTKTSEAALENARAELVKLQNADAQNIALWQAVCNISYKQFEATYQRLGVTFTHTLGESFYKDKVQRVYTELTQTGLAQESEGALVVFHPEHPRFSKQPFMLRKSDGASNYATTDAATMLHRAEAFNAQAIYIVVDDRQSDHFQQLHLTTQKWFKAKGYTHPMFEHVSFGKILGEDGKAIKTRSGQPIQLKALMDEACTRAAAIVETKSPHLPEAEKETIANAIGLSALKYADLSQNRSTDYKFSWNKMLSFEGNTAPYLMYAAARIHSLAAKAQEAGITAQLTQGAPLTAEESALVRQLATFPMALAHARETARPHFLCTYGFELASAFSTFYNACPILKEGTPAPTQQLRLALAQQTCLQLETVLKLLSIEPLQRM